MATSSDSGRDTLSTPASLLHTLGLPLLTAAIYPFSPATAVFTPLIATPTAILLYRRSNIPPQDRPATSETLTWTWAAAATVAPPVCMIVQGLLSYASAALVFRGELGDYVEEFTQCPGAVRTFAADRIAKRASMAQSWPYLLYTTIFSFALAGLPEEVAKLAILRLIEWHHYRNEETGANSKALTTGDYLVYASAFGLGFSFFEGVAFMYAGASTGEGWRLIFETAVERALYGTAAHVLTAVLTGLRLAESRGAQASSSGTKKAEEMRTRDRTGRGGLEWFRIVLPSMLFHGGGNAIIMGACALDGHPGWVPPETWGKLAKYAVGPVVIVTGLGLQVAREMRRLGVNWTGLPV